MISKYHKIDKMSKSKLADFANNPSTFLEPFEETPAMTLGTAVDVLFYTPELFNKQFQILDWTKRPEIRYDKGKVNMAWLEEQRKTAEEQEMDLITSEDEEKARNIAKKLRLDPEIMDMLENSVIHKVFFGEINGVEFKCEIDNMYNIGDNLVLCDLKTIYDLNKFDRRAKYEYSYRMMPYVYAELIKQNGAQIDQVEFLAVDTQTFDWQRFIVSDEYMDASKELVIKYLDRYKECKRTGVWSQRSFGEQVLYPVGDYR